MKVLAITQARYGSTRLPAKILKEVNNMSLLEIHLKRILQSNLITKLKVATTTEKGAELIINVANKLEVETYQGSIHDVLERFYKAAKTESPDYVVRLTSDCPLIDPIVIDDIIAVCVESGFDYVSNVLKPTFPDGMDVEVFKFSALEKAYKKATLKSDREHVTPYIWRNSSYHGLKLFTSQNVNNANDYSNYRMTVDTMDDFDLIKVLIEQVGIDKSLEEYISFLDKHKNLKKMNQHCIRNEGYSNSLLND